MIRTGPWASRQGRERLLREARLVARLDHPGIVAIHAIGEHHGQPFLALEFLPGGSLDGRLDGQPWPVEQAVRLVEQLARAVHHAHLHGIVHRDLKPANVLMAEDGTAKVADFGLARHPQDSGGTRTGSVMGTPQYMAPEQAAGKTREIGPAADVHALGLILYELLTGKPAFSGGNLLEILQNVRDRAPSPLRPLRRELPRELETICLRCLAKDPAGRYPDAEALAEDLQRFLSVTRIASPRRLRGFIPALIAGCCALLLGVAFCLLLVRPRESLPESPLVTQAPDIAPVPENGPAVIARDGKPQREKLEGKAPVLVALDKGKEEPPASAEVVKKSTPGKEAVVKEGDKEISNSIGMKLVRIPKGKFMRESPKAEEGDDNDRPQHEVKITKAFYMGIYPVTQAEYLKVMGTNPSDFKADGGSEDQVKGKDTSGFPVERVSWHDAGKFCETLSALPQEKAVKRRYRLPSEAEWEYACRAGTRTKYHSGDDEDDLKKVGWYKANSDNRTHNVGKKMANTFGLFDMHGNVLQWCSDWFDLDYYKESSTVDPGGPKTGDKRVLRGGCYGFSAEHCRAAYRGSGAPDARGINIGFRVVCVPS
jgi:formylglycine-generating enzyme required for sulfatase activity